MLLQLMLAAVPDLLKGFLLASVVGAVSYFGLLVIKQPKIRAVSALIAFLVFLVSCYQLLVPSAFIYTLCAVLVVPSLAASAQKRVIANGTGWMDGYFSLFLCTFLTMSGLYLLYFHARPSLISISDLAGVTMFAVGLIAPSIYAWFQLIAQNSRLRPGFDRHLLQGEYPK